MATAKKTPAAKRPTKAAAKSDAGVTGTTQASAPANDPEPTGASVVESAIKAAEPSVENNTPTQPEGQLMIRTRRGVARFRRAGFAFTREPLAINRADLTDEHYDALKNESRLEVKTLPVESDEAHTQ